MADRTELSLEDLRIDSDIRHAETLPGAFYGHREWHQRSVDRVFARSWQFLGREELVRVPGQVHPTLLLEGCLDEPILLTRDRDDVLHCLSNVCTHRANLVCDGATVAANLRCRYHGRRFGLDGQFLSMPEFEDVEGFPCKSDSLPRLPFGSWRGFLFAGVAPPTALDLLTREMESRIGWLPIEEASLDPKRSRDYVVDANWALYCDNYLEGFHIPYVHNSLAAALDYGDYRTELFEGGVLQVGIAEGGEDLFALPESSPDFGQKIAAYYFWLFPNTMFNVYPWGISVNVVRPLAVDRTRVSFLAYVWDSERLDRGAGSGLDRVEREDEAVVEGVHKGARSRLYTRGRYSPTRETGLHHFHRMLVEQLASDSGDGDEAR
ncbi:MAG: aromatic ring-hydroxylating dioxygenase subunit alpha [Thermoanaerobaculia bacterium]|nr:aromatic ring-hydroxylating dioxygenase subunit alpha [Thermoanaerobaculia bacterium]